MHNSETKSNPVLRHLALLSPNHPSWLQCLEKLNTVPEYFGWEHRYDPHEDYPRRMGAFQVFVRGGCVDEYGLDVTGFEQDEDDRPDNPPTNMRLPSSLLHRFRWRRDRELKNKEVVGSGGEV